jgi:serine/threonine protein kinase
MFRSIQVMMTIDTKDNSIFYICMSMLVYPKLCFPFSFAIYFGILKMDVCDQWKLNKSINPRTNRKIKPTGKVYKDLETECASKSPTRRRAGGPRNLDPYSPKCLKWRNNPTVNPTTDRKIKIGGPTYQKLEEECGPPVAAPAPPRAPPQNDKQAEPNCDEWRANPSMNPKTGRAISPRGKIYQWYQKNCGDVGTGTPSKRTWFTERLDKGLRINNGLRAINADQWNMCMTGTNAPAFRANFSNVVEIGKGSFGQVYRATINDDELAIKEAYLRPNENRILKKATGQNQKWETIKKNSYPRENRILDLVNQLLLSRRCPNFVYVYNMAMCDGCRVQRLFDIEKPTSGSCYVTFMESAITDLEHVDLLNFEEQLSVLYQLLIAVYAIHRYYAIWHRDIKTSNVLVSLIKPGGYFEYVIEGKTYYVKNAGVVAYLADFGVAEVMSPLYAFTNYYGSRNAEVMRSSREVDGSNLYWKPISLLSKPPIDWHDRTTGSKVMGTSNLITNPNIESSVPINLNSNQKFPAFEFFDDIQDVIRIFVGGKQAAQPGSHTPMRTLSPELKDLIVDKQAYLPSRSSMYQIHGTVKYVLVYEMLDQLYIKPRSVDNVVDRFVM